jgi:predicted TIM-barrel fold metal-dependent hydrolase
METTMTRIDAHIHWNADHPECAEFLDEAGIRLVNISVPIDNSGAWRERSRPWPELARSDPSRFAWVTSFDLPRFDDPDYVERVIEGLRRDFASGAVACKVWKNIGMEVKTPSGDWLMIDDPIFQPVFDFLAREEQPLVAHIGEPLDAWRPLTEQSAHFGYYSRNPQWHWHGRTDVPSHADIIAARDRMIAKNPRLRVIGAHLGSLEYDVSELARRFDNLPNFAADTSARTGDLARQDSATVAAFLGRYADRILWGTDMVYRDSFAGMSNEDRRGTIEGIRRRYAMEAAYYETDGSVDVRGHQTTGLALDAKTLDRIYHANAVAWYPRLGAAGW